MDKKEATVELSRLVSVAKEALQAATNFADEHKLSFSWNPSYGMGGSYIGDPEERWKEDYYGDDGWHSSSMGC